MIRVLLLAAVSLSCLSSYAEEDYRVAPPETTDMKPLFNGKDLSGWDGDTRLWSVKDGVIHGETTKENATKGNTFLIWKDGKTEDFELRLSFRCNATNNSGIQYRSKHLSEGKQVRNPWVVQGYQHEIRNQDALPDVSGFIYDERGRRGRIIHVGQKGTWKDNQLVVSDESLISKEEFKKLFHLNGWNDVVIRAQGNHIQHFLNGRLILDFTDSPEHALKSGVLALQLHAGKPMWAEFKNIRFKSGK